MLNKNTNTKIDNIMKNFKINALVVFVLMLLLGNYIYAMKSSILLPQNDYERLNANRKIGKKITNVKLPDINGKTRNLTDFVVKGKKKVLLIDFWATWCGPCMREMPNVKAAYDKYHKKGFNVIGISFDNDGTKWKTTIKKNGWKWNHLSDLKGWQCAAGEVYGIHAIPSSILVDGNGIIIANDLRGEELVNKLRSIYGF